MLRLFPALAACVLLTACVSSSATLPADPPPVHAHNSGAAPAGRDDTAIREASRRFWETRDGGDAAALAAHFTEDGILMVPGLPDATGRTAVQDLLKIRFNVARTRDFRVDRREIQMAGDAAHELGWLSETLGPPANATRMEGHYVLVWKRGTDAVWRVQRYLYNFSGATPLAPPSQ